MKAGSFKRFRRMLRKGCLLIVTSLLILFAAVHTPFVQDQLAKKISQLLSKDDISVELSGLRGRWPFHVNLQQVTVDDGDGIWLNIEQIQLNWQFKAKQIDIHELSIAKLDLKELPELQPTIDKAVENDPFKKTEWAYVLSKLRIDELSIGESITGTNLVGQLDASALLPANSSTLAIRALLNLDDKSIQLDSSLDLSDKHLQTQAKAQILETHRLVAQLDYQNKNFSLESLIESPDLRELLQEAIPYAEKWSNIPSLIESNLPDESTEPFAFTLNSKIEKTADLISGENSLQFQAGRIELPLQYRMAEKELSIQSDFSIADLSPIGAFCGYPVNGILEGSFHVLQQPDKREISATLAGSELQYNQLDLGQIKTEVTSTETGFSSQWQWQRLVGENTQQAELHLAWDLNKKGWSLISNKLELQAPPLQLALTKPIKLTQRDGAYNIAPSSLLLNQQAINLHAAWDAEKFHLQVELPELNPAGWPHSDQVSFKGKVSSRIQAEGTWEKPTANAEIAFDGITISHEDISDKIMIKGAAKGEWSPQGLSLNGHLSDNKKNHFEFSSGSTQAWSLSPLTLPNLKGNWHAKLSGDLDLSILNRFRWMEKQRLLGKAHADLQFTQENAKKRRLSGSAKLSQGSYENYQLGTHIQHIDLALQMDGSKVIIKNATARTAGKGKISANGEWDIEEKPGQGKFNIRLDEARIMHLDPVQAALSGNLWIERKPSEKIMVGGKLVMEETTFHMDRLPRAIPEPLPYKIKGAPEVVITEKLKQNKPATKTTDAFGGEIQLNIPGRLTVEGKNIFSTWEGQFKLGFRQGQIALDGELVPRRGTVTFFGRAFRLTKGTVYFNDIAGTPPILNLEAEYNREDVDALLQISGRADNPKFKLSSSPPLPDDEILSRILFGKDMATITGLQAVEVGLALKSMMDSEGSDWDLIGKARDILGVDQLGVRESGDAEGSAELVAGRQINNRLYLEFNQSLKEPGSSIILEYELRRNFSITTETGTHILPGIGINWKKDY